MQTLATKTYLFLELLNFLNYHEIASLRGVARLLRDRIDNIDIWTKVIHRDYPNLVFICEQSTSTSLALLKNKLKHKELSPNLNINIGIFGSMGQFPKELNEADTLSRAGFLGSLKEFVCNIGYCRFNIVAFPKVADGKCQKRLITTFLILAKSENGWEEKVSQMIEETLNIGIAKFVVGLRVDENHPFVAQLREQIKYVVAVDALTKENVKKMMKALYSAYDDKDLINTEESLITPESVNTKTSPTPSQEPPKSDNKKKCLVS